METNTKRQIKLFLFYIGILIQIIGFILYLQNVFMDPLYMFIFIIMGYLLVLWICFERLLRKKNIKPIRISDNNMRKKEYYYSNRLRVFSGVIISISTIVFIVFIYNLLFSKTYMREAPSPMNEIQEYRKRQNTFSLVDIFNINWTGGGSYALIEGGTEIPLALIINPKLINPTIFHGKVCAIEFDLDCRPKNPWIYIDQIQVNVHSYKKLPKYKSIILQPFQESDIYYVEIDNPDIVHTNVFNANYFYIKDQIKKFGKVKLDKNKPETFLVRINARTPGIYNFSVDILLSYKEKKERITVVTKQDYLFDGNYYDNH